MCNCTPVEFCGSRVRSQKHTSDHNGRAAERKRCATHIEHRRSNFIQQQLQIRDSLLNSSELASGSTALVSILLLLLLVLLLVLLLQLHVLLLNRRYCVFYQLAALAPVSTVLLLLLLLLL
jgi:hypothetical protein